MNPLHLGSSPERFPTEFTQLFDQLGSRPSPAVVWYAESGDRVELSGRVLVNWAVKLVGLLRDEAEIDDDAGEVLVDMTPHWKTAAVVLAAGALGATVRLVPTAHAQFASNDDGGSGRSAPLRAEAAGQLSLVVTDRPSAWLDSEALGSAELAAVSHGMLDASFTAATGEELPAWVLDVSAEARQQPDQLIEPLPAVPLPEPAAEPASPMVITAWSEDSAELMLGTWARAGVVVLFDSAPEGPVWEQMLRQEGMS